MLSFSLFVGSTWRKEGHSRGHECSFDFFIIILLLCCGFGNKGTNKKETEREMLRKGQQGMKGDAGLFIAVKYETLLQIGFVF